jgi:hypothetical protein
VILLGIGGGGDSLNGNQFLTYLEKSSKLDYISRSVGKIKSSSF